MPYTDVDLSDQDPDRSKRSRLRMAEGCGWV